MSPFVTTRSTPARGEHDEADDDGQRLGGDPTQPGEQPLVDAFAATSSGRLGSYSSVGRIVP